MTHNNQTTMSPQLSELFLNFLNRPVNAESLHAEVAALGKVEPHEVAVGFRAEPRMAWQEGMEAITSQIPAAQVATASPSEWAGMVVRHSSLPALPFAVGNYPQRVRDLTILVQAKDLGKLRPHGEQTELHSAPGSIRSWVAKQMQKGDTAVGLAAVGVLRAAQDFDLASEYLQTLIKHAKPEWEAVLANEEATILWHRGKAEEAFARWNALPETSVILFNRGMAALFLDRPAVAHESLTKAVKGFADSSAWHHLASLYLAVSEMRT